MEGYAETYVRGTCARKHWQLKRGEGDNDNIAEGGLPVKAIQSDAGEKRKMREGACVDSGKSVCNVQYVRGVTALR